MLVSNVSPLVLLGFLSLANAHPISTSSKPIQESLLYTAEKGRECQQVPLDEIHDLAKPGEHVKVGVDGWYLSSESAEEGKCYVSLAVTAGLEKERKMIYDRWVEIEEIFKKGGRIEGTHGEGGRERAMEELRKREEVGLVIDRCNGDKSDGRPDWTC